MSKTSLSLPPQELETSTRLWCIEGVPQCTQKSCSCHEMTCPDSLMLIHRPLCTIYKYGCSLQFSGCHHVQSTENCQRPRFVLKECDPVPRSSARPGNPVVNPCCAVVTAGRIQKKARKTSKHGGRRGGAELGPAMRPRWLTSETQNGLESGSCILGQEKVDSGKFSVSQRHRPGANCSRGQSK